MSLRAAVLPMMLIEIRKEKLMKQTKRRKMTILCIVILVIIQTRPGYAAWYQDAAGWRYEQQGVDLRESWIEESSGKYYLNAAGQLLTGWQVIQGFWYFLNPVADGSKGRCLSGWQWIEGYCYYFDEQGRLVVNTVTPDGYPVNGDGQWMEQDVPVYVAGAGYRTSHGAGLVTGAGSGSGGRRSTGGSSGGNSSSGGKYNSSGTISYDSEISDISDSSDSTAGSIDRGSTTSVAESPSNLGDIASPSEAEKINWTIRFVDRETHNVTLAADRSGKIAPGGDITVNFLSRVIKDGEIWECLAESPLKITVHGPGACIYYIEYVNTGSVQQDEDPYQAERDLLDHYLATAKEWEAEITGEAVNYIPETRFFITDQAANNQRLQTIATRISDVSEYVFYGIGKNFEPNGMGITSYLGDAAVYSKSLEEVIEMEEDIYYVVRFTVQRAYHPDNCSHNWELTRENAGAASSCGFETWACLKCGSEMECYIGTSGQGHWQPGDVQVREIDGQVYMFQCIDQNYSDRTENHRQSALFLCTSVIPSNIGSIYHYEEQPDGTYDYVFQPGPIVNFGMTNDYKFSNIRSWLEDSRDNFDDAEEISIGVDNSYMGSTASGRFSKLNDDGLRGNYIGNQKLTGNLFILSVDEALKYKDYLWKFDGSAADNPETQYSAYSKAYWLRNPMGTAADYAQTGQVYVVDLVNGNIHSQTVKPKAGSGVDEELSITGTVGVRPAFAVPQN